MPNWKQSSPPRDLSAIFAHEDKDSKATALPTVLIPNPGLLPARHATLPFLAARLENLIFSPGASGIESTRFIYSKFENDGRWNYLWMLWRDTTAKTLPQAGREGLCGTVQRLPVGPPSNSVKRCFQNSRLGPILQPAGTENETSQ